MTQKIKACYGSWKSPIGSKFISYETIRMEQVFLDGQDTYWIESRPSEGGRSVIVRRTEQGKKTDITPANFNIRTLVHEYGGGAYLVHKGVIYFSNFQDQCLYQQALGRVPKAISPQKNLRYADGIIDNRRARIISVCEDHTHSEREAVNTLVSLWLDGHDNEVLVSGSDFYSSPRLSPDGSFLAWLSWNHPNMPWDGTELWVGTFQPDGSLAEVQKVAGGIEESIFQPEWSPDGVLHFVSDRNGWWNIYHWLEESVEPLVNMEAEFGRPQWAFNNYTYAFESKENIICAYTQKGTWHLASLDIQTNELRPISTPYTEIAYLRARPGHAVFVAGSPTETTSIVQLDLASKEIEVLQRSTKIPIDPGYISMPETLMFPTKNCLKAHAFYYPPQNKDYVAPMEEKPPLVVMSHGGPTSATTNALYLTIQYWTSRGFAVLDVNYQGSTGYGRDYRRRLTCQWGIIDVDDCANGALYLVEKGLVDGRRLAIRGRSAGGYTTLCALTFVDAFQAGASYYGITDLEKLARETHKFESRYLNNLIGPYPERRDLYIARSPINFVNNLYCPVIFFQGLEDKIVPPIQALKMFDAIKAKGLPVAYVPFKEEQHGFRRSENIQRAMEAELYFYSMIFGFELAEAVEPVAIENFPKKVCVYSATKSLD